MPTAWDDPKRLAKAIRDARGQASQKALAASMGWDRKTWSRMENGDLQSLGSTPEKRKAKAAVVAAATGRYDLFDLTPPAEPNSTDQDVRSIRAVLKSERAERQAFEEETRKRLTRLEQLGEGTGS